MEEIVALLRANAGIIPVIKAYRARYNVGLREAKDAVELVRYAMGLTPNPGWRDHGYIVAADYLDNPGDYTVDYFDTRESALSEAAAIVEKRHSVTVAVVISRSVVTRKMQEVS